MNTCDESDRIELGKGEVEAYLLYLRSEAKRASKKQCEWGSGSNSSSSESINGSMASTWSKWWCKYRRSVCVCVRLPSSNQDKKKTHKAKTGDNGPKQANKTKQNKKKKLGKQGHKHDAEWGMIVHTIVCSLCCGCVSFSSWAITVLVDDTVRNTLSEQGGGERVPQSVSVPPCVLVSGSRLLMIVLCPVLVSNSDLLRRVCCGASERQCPSIAITKQNQKKANVSIGRAWLAVWRGAMLQNDPECLLAERAVRVAVVLSVSLWAILCERARVRLRVVAYEGGRAIRCSAKRLWKF